MHIDEFRRIVDSGKMSLFCFCSKWCGPCEAVSNALRAIREEVPNLIDMYEIDMDEAPSLAKELGVLGIPMIMIFEGGTLKHTVLGHCSKTSLLRKIQALRHTSQALLVR